MMRYRDGYIVTCAVAEERSAGITIVREVMSDGVCHRFEDDDVNQAAQIMGVGHGGTSGQAPSKLNPDKWLAGVFAGADLD